jgi:hypothetical protein
MLALTPERTPHGHRGNRKDPSLHCGPLRFPPRSGENGGPYEPWRRALQCAEVPWQQATTRHCRLEAKAHGFQANSAPWRLGVQVAKEPRRIGPLPPCPPAPPKIVRPSGKRNGSRRGSSSVGSAIADLFDFRPDHPGRSAMADPTNLGGARSNAPRFPGNERPRDIADLRPRFAAIKPPWRNETLATWSHMRQDGNTPR